MQKPRTEPTFNGAISPEDCFVWQTKVERAVEASSRRRQVMLFLGIFFIMAALSRAIVSLIVLTGKPFFTQILLLLGCSLAAEIYFVRRWRRLRPQFEVEKKNALQSGDATAFLRAVASACGTHIASHYAALMFFISGYVFMAVPGLRPDQASFMPAPVAAPIVPASGMVSSTCTARSEIMPQISGMPMHGEIVGMVSPAEAQQMIVKTEQAMGATIDPAYVKNQRVTVQLPSGLISHVLVPKGMNLHVGETISFTASYMEPGPGCFYVPNLITP